VRASAGALNCVAQAAATWPAVTLCCSCSSVDAACRAHLQL